MDLEVSWLDGGRKVLARCADGTMEVWDAEKNVKWRMLKPQGKITGITMKDRAILRGQDSRKVLVSADGDGVTRFWNID